MAKKEEKEKQSTWWEERRVWKGQNNDTNFHCIIFLLLASPLFNLRSTFRHFLPFPTPTIHPFLNPLTRTHTARGGQTRIFSLVSGPSHSLFPFPCFCISFFHFLIFLGLLFGFNALSPKLLRHFDALSWILLNPLQKGIS
ncbi:hypothetical protein SDJN03_18346, partial [Cucurbita argyrosperma subsp. sororia]